MAARPSPSVPRRWRFQFSLRLLLSVITLSAILLGLRIWQFRRQEEAIEAVQRLGGSVIFGAESPASGVLPPLFFPKVSMVNLQGTQTTNEDIEPLGALSGLQSLNLSNTKITAGGLAPLAGLTGLTSLSLAQTGIDDDDLAQLRRLKGLTSVDLSGTAVSDAGLGHLGSLAALESLSLGGTNVTGAGLEHLGGLPRLAMLWLDESQITATAVDHLQKMPGLKILRVHVAGGTGKRAWELLAPLSNIAASGLQRPDGRALWVTAAAWEDTSAGVAERIGALVPLKPQEKAILLDALAEACPNGAWPDSRIPPLPPPTPKVIPDQDKIRTIDQLMEAMKRTDYESFKRVRLFAESEGARSAVPVLLKLLDEPKRKDSDYMVFHRAAFLLIRIAGADRQVVAALARSLSSNDARLRVDTVYAFNDTDAERAGKFGLKISAEQAEALLPLLLGRRKDPAPHVRSELAQAMTSIVRLHPKHAKAVVPVLLELFQDRDSSVSQYASSALGRIAEVCPDQAGPIAAKLLVMLEGGPPQAEWRVLETLGYVARWDREAARAAAPVLVGALRRGGEPAGRSVGYALGAIVRNHPEQLKTVIPALFALLQDQDPAVRRAAALALPGVATAVSGQKKPP